jgi:hypothetical protein
MTSTIVFDILDFVHQGENMNQTTFNIGAPGGQDFNFNPNDSKGNYNNNDINILYYISRSQ